MRKILTMPIITDAAFDVLVVAVPAPPLPPKPGLEVVTIIGPTENEAQNAREADRGSGTVQR
jgi:hypothetical protein